jgi:hypothetical protein
MADLNSVSLRDLFAAFALAGMIGKPDIHHPVAATTLASTSSVLPVTDDQLADRAFRLADAMLKARDRPSGGPAPT